jgi:hypothetical protein
MHTPVLFKIDRGRLTDLGTRHGILEEFRIIWVDCRDLRLPELNWPCRGERVLVRPAAVIRLVLTAAPSNKKVTATAA